MICYVDIKINRPNLSACTIKKSALYWTGYCSTQVNTADRDGPVRHNGKFWSSTNGKHISYPNAVIDDFGSLVPVA